MKIYLYIISLSIILLSFACEQEGDIINPGPSTFSGSYAKMLSKGNFLYHVNNSELLTFSILDRASPIEIDRQQLDFGIESLFVNGQLMFIGSTSSLYIYKINEDGIPSLLSQTGYLENDVLPCDPVVANDSIAFVTLSTATTDPNDRCFRTIEVNELRLYEISNLENPQFLASFSMDEPKGLGLDKNWLFVCEKENGLKVFDVSNSNDVLFVHHFEGFQTFDVIPINGLLLVVGPNNLYQFDYSDMDNMKLLSTFVL